MGRPVRELATARAGDKGDVSNVGVVARSDRDYAVLERRLTAERVRDEFEGIATGPVTRYELPQLNALNFVIEGALGGGVTTALRLDAHGKSLSYVVLGIELEE